MLGTMQGSTLQSLVELFIHKYIHKKYHEIQLHFTGILIAHCAVFLPPMLGSNSLIIHAAEPTS
jgi:hypothetical protein